MDLKAFFNSVRQSVFSPALTEDRVLGCQSVITAMAGLPTSYTAYALATAFHETMKKMQPINEMGGDAYFTKMYGIKGMRPTLAREMGNTEPGDGIKYHGRGYVQLTWKDNYQKASDKLGVNLVQKPEVALQPKIAAEIMRHGMVEGWFSGKTLGDYLPASGNATLQEFAHARHIINGTDRATLIAGYASAFQSAIGEAL